MFFLIQEKDNIRRDVMHSCSVLCFFHIKKNNLDVDLQGNGTSNEKNLNAILEVQCQTLEYDIVVIYRNK